MRFYPRIVDDEDNIEWRRTHRNKRKYIDLPYGADEINTEQEMTKIGLYAPRGPEVIVWYGRDVEVPAVIFDAYRNPSIILERK